MSVGLYPGVGPWVLGRMDHLRGGGYGCWLIPEDESQS